jgi:hypothetical protein
MSIEDIAAVLARHQCEGYELTPHAIEPALEALNVQVALGKVDLIPMQIDGFSHAQAMAGHDED